MKILTRQVETLGYNAVLKFSKKLDSKLKNKNLEALSMGIGRQNDLLRRLSSECPNCGCRNTDRGKIERVMSKIVQNIMQKESLLENQKQLIK